MSEYKNNILIVLFISFVFSFEVSNAVNKNGMVVCSKHDAAQIGVDILKRGGNAVDAAVGVAFALAVTHPSAGNIGGGGFMVIRFADGGVTTIDFREKAPSSAYRDMFLDNQGNVIPGKSRYTSWSVGVPGTVYGLGYAHQKYGSLDWDSLVYPAVSLAKFGFKLDFHNIMILNSDRYRTLLSNDAVSKLIFTKDNNFEINELFIQKDLSQTLSRIAKYGFREFYEGKTADYILKCMNRTDGLITKNDLKNYNVEERKAIEFSYRGHHIYSMPPSSSGGITLALILNQLENYNVKELGFHSSKHVHLFSEVEKRAYADRANFLGDMDFVDIPIETLISKEYAFERSSNIKLKKSTSSNKIKHGEIVYNEQEETTHFSIVDNYGNAVSLTTTINGWYGSGITVDNAGFVLNNEMDDFSSKPGEPNMYGLVGSHANSIEPNKRMLSSMTPTIVENSEGDLFLVLGTPGGSTIITTIAQIITNVIDFDMSLKESVESKRFHHQWLPDVIQIEKNSLGKDVIDNLILYGHDIKYRSSIGEANCILINKNLKFGCSDSRRGSVAIGY
ncbi:MAG: gamma-glutamyltransferase [Candidatus Marinimicrobia bacterium]|nr:gamma-glutamyltransferase [Candidatus Neomarinimicrobiota bacterium]